MSDGPSYEEMDALGAQVLSAFDQFNAFNRSMMKALAVVERGCITAGMSERLAAAFTMKVAEGFGWPVVPSRGPS